MKQKPYNFLQLALRYLRYYITAGNGKGHGIHSPFVYAFIREVLNDRKRYYAYDRVESLREKLLHNKKELEVLDLGAGSSKGLGASRTVASITRSAAKPAKLGKLLFRVVNHFRPACMVELGTSMGITSAYLASGNVQGRLFTIEGSPGIARQAGENLRALGVGNAELREGNFDDQLPLVLQEAGTIDLAYIDGNHRYEPTLRYFEMLRLHAHDQTVLVLDDIHWSGEMEQAWEAIKSHPDVTCSIDIFFMGFIFFRPEFKVSQHFSIRF